MSGNWIKLNRSILEKDIGQNPLKLALWTWILLNCKWKPCQEDHRGQKLNIEPGQFYVQIKNTKMGTELGYKRALKWIRQFEKEERIRVLNVNRGMLITVCNWEEYQGTNDRVGTDMGTERELTISEVGTEKGLKGNRHGHRVGTDNPNLPVILPELQLPKKERRKEDNIYSPNPKDEILYNHWKKWSQTVSQTVKPNLQAWCEEFRKLREIDNLTHEEIWQIFTFIRKDSFWAKNCVSPLSLRKRSNNGKLKWENIKDSRTHDEPPRRNEEDWRML